MMIEQQYSNVDDADRCFSFFYSFVGPANSMPYLNLIGVIFKISVSGTITTVNVFSSKNDAVGNNAKFSVNES